MDLKPRPERVDIAVVRLRRRPNSEALYRQGVECWAKRDIEGAVELLGAALDASLGPFEDNWWFSASRTMALVALEQGDVEAAEPHLVLIPGHGVGNAQQEALRAKVSLQRGEQEWAPLKVSVAVEQLGSDEDDDLGTLMNGAIALLWCGEVLVELGYGREAARLVGMARQRIARAGVEDPMLEGGLAMVAAAAARLAGDRNEATATLASVDPSISPDFGFQVRTEQARLAWNDGDHDIARRLYAEAADQAKAMRYPAAAAALRVEAGTGPVAPRTDPLPVEQWANRRLEEDLANLEPYAVVVRLAMEDRSPDPYLELGQQIEELLEADPDLGGFDGFGTVDHTWELFLNGADPGALWESVNPLMDGLAGPGSEVELRKDDGVETRPLS